jgi:hypothetical protein
MTRRQKWSAFLSRFLSFRSVGKKLWQCGSPAGATFTESFAGSSTACWRGGPTGCNQSWQVRGANYSITASPAGAPPDTACTNSLSLAASATPRHILPTFGVGFVTVNDLNCNDVSGRSMGCAVAITLHSQRLL